MKGTWQSAVPCSGQCFSHPISPPSSGPMQKVTFRTRFWQGFVYLQFSASLLQIQLPKLESGVSARVVDDFLCAECWWFNFSLVLFCFMRLFILVWCIYPFKVGLRLPIHSQLYVGRYSFLFQCFLLSEGLDASESLQCLPFVAYGMTGFMGFGLSIRNNNIIIKALK